MKEEIYQLLFDGKTDEALVAADQAVEHWQHKVNFNDPVSVRTYALALETRGDVHRERDELDAAQDDYLKAVGQLQDLPEDYPQIGSLHSSIGAIYHALGSPTEAAHHWQIAIRYFENSSPPLLVDVATIANNLGFLYKSCNDLDSAENCFLRALEIMHEKFGQYDEQTATVFCNLGTLYQQAGFVEQSVKMHTMALNTRKKMLGRYHPDTAQSNNNLALALATAGDHDGAIRHFEDSYKSFKALGHEHAPDLEAVCDNYCSFLQSIGKTDEAAEVACRLGAAPGA